MTRDDGADGGASMGRWAAVAERAVEALGVWAGEVVQFRDRTGRYVMVQEPLPPSAPRGHAHRAQQNGEGDGQARAGQQMDGRTRPVDKEAVVMI